MVRIGVAPRPFPSSAEAICDSSDRPGTVFSSSRFGTTFTVAPSTRSVPPRELLTQRPLHNSDDVGPQVSRRVGVRRAASKWQRQGSFEGRRVHRTAITAERSITPGNSS